MSPRETLPNSVGFTGPDGVGKTNFALLTIDLLRQHGNKVVFCPFPFLLGTASGQILRSLKKHSVAPIAIPPIYAMNRVEVLPALKEWVSRDEKHHVVFDRVWQDGPVFAEGLGDPGDYIKVRTEFEKSRGRPVGNLRADYKQWLRALDVWFPEVNTGFYITRPLRESVEIMMRRPEAEAIKSKFDRNMRVQRYVRRQFPKEFDELENWTTVKVKGVASGERELREWQVPYMIRIWRTLCARIDHIEWTEFSVEKILDAQERIANAKVDLVLRETMLTARKLSRTSKMRGVHSWVPKQKE